MDLIASFLLTPRHASGSHCFNKPHISGWWGAGGSGKVCQFIYIIRLVSLACGGGCEGRRWTKGHFPSPVEILCLPPDYCRWPQAITLSTRPGTSALVSASTKVSELLKWQLPQSCLPQHIIMLLRKLRGRLEICITNYQPIEFH